MNAGDIERIMMLANCTEETAKNALFKTQDVVDAVDLILEIPPTRGAPKIKIKKDDTYSKIRVLMEESEDQIQKSLKKSSQPDSSSQALLRTLSPFQEEMKLRSDCTQYSQIPVREEEEQKQETACQ